MFTQSNEYQAYFWIAIDSVPFLPFTWQGCLQYRIPSSRQIYISNENILQFSLPWTLLRPLWIFQFPKKHNFPPQTKTIVSITQECDFRINLELVLSSTMACTYMSVPKLLLPPFEIYALSQWIGKALLLHWYPLRKQYFNSKFHQKDHAIRKGFSTLVHVRN